MGVDLPGGDTSGPATQQTGAVEGGGATAQEAAAAARRAEQTVGEAAGTGSRQQQHDGSSLHLVDVLRAFRLVKDAQ